MMELIDLYLDVAKLDAGQMAVESARLNLATVAHKCMEEQASLAAERRIDVSLDIPLVLTVEADDRLLSRVIQNVLNNALKFSPEGGRITISAAPGAREQVDVSIRDTGPGIDPEDLLRLFDRYHQAETRRAGRRPGTGLGLAFCREALEAMHGGISVESRLGSGSVFILHLTSAAHMEES